MAAGESSVVQRSEARWPGTCVALVKYVHGSADGVSSARFALGREDLASQLHSRGMFTVVVAAACVETGRIIGIPYHPAPGDLQSCTATEISRTGLKR